MCSISNFDFIYIDVILYGLTQRQKLKWMESQLHHHCLMMLSHFNAVLTHAFDLLANSCNYIPSASGKDPDIEYGHLGGIAPLAAH